MNISLNLYVTVNTSNWGSGKNLAKHFYKTPEENKALTVVEKRLATAEPADSHMQGHTFRSIVGRKDDMLLLQSSGKGECNWNYNCLQVAAADEELRGYNNNNAVHAWEHLCNAAKSFARKHTFSHTHTHTHIWVWTRGQTHTHSHVFERVYWHEQTSRCNHSSQQPQAGYELWKRHATCDMWHEIRMSLAWCIPMNLWHIRIQCKQRVFGQRHFTVLPTRFILLPLLFDCASAGPMLWSSTFGQISNEHQPAPPPPPL